MKTAAALLATTLAISYLPQHVDAHAFLLLPKAEFVLPEKNFYAYTVPGEKVPPFSSYTTGDAERNSQGFTANYKKLNPPSLKEFILKNEEPVKDMKPGGTAECGYSKADEPAQPLPDHIEFGNYNLQNPSGLHPGPCEAWCDDEIVIPFTEDCRKLFQKPIPYAKDKCVGKKRFTFYWLATHFAPFQVYIGCAPLQGGGSSGGNSGNGGNGNSQSGNRGTNNGGGNSEGQGNNKNNGNNSGGNNNKNNGNNGNHNNSNNGNRSGNARARSYDFEDIAHNHTDSHMW